MTPEYHKRERSVKKSSERNRNGKSALYPMPVKTGSMNQSIRDIYADYKYALLKIGLTLKSLTLDDLSDQNRVGELLEKAENLETLIDLYAYLVACQGPSQRL